MRSVRLDSHADFDGWRREARCLLQARIKPEDVAWEVEGTTTDLFGDPQSAPLAPQSEAARRCRVPRPFLTLAATAICHSHPERFARLYRLLFRLQQQPGLLNIASDGDIMQTGAWSKAVRRDVHKMHAFVRFRRVEAPEDEAGEAFVAWFEPDHHIVERASSFFKKRFASMRWSILTPKGSVHWDRCALTFTGPQQAADAPVDDALDAWWRIYYRSIFNPARLKVDAMQAEMPKKYWRNMPETRLIPELIRAASVRTDAMIERAPSAPPIRHIRQQCRAAATVDKGEAPALSLDALYAQATGCRACPLWRDAGRLVFGEGPSDAELCIIGEQPGDQEDLGGRPFVGPAGKMLDEALAASGIDREKVYLTNAVKHFKFVQRGKRRIHQRPNVGEIDHCRWWLAEELRLLAPRLIVALGATAARAVLKREITISESRGLVLPGAEGIDVLVTTHPAYLLRLQDQVQRDSALEDMVQDLETAKRHLVEQPMGVTG